MSNINTPLHRRRPHPAALDNTKEIAHARRLLARTSPFSVWSKRNPPLSNVPYWILFVGHILKGAALTCEQEQLAKTLLELDAAIAFAEANHVQA